MANQAWGSLVWLLVFFGIMYFTLIRPQQQQQKKRNEMLASLKEGDKIVTIGGIIGYITKVDKDTLLVRIAEKTEVELQKSGVAAVIR